MSKGFSGSKDYITPPEGNILDSDESVTMFSCRRDNGTLIMEVIPEAESEELG